MTKTKELRSNKGKTKGDDRDKIGKKSHEAKTHKASKWFRPTRATAQINDRKLKQKTTKTRYAVKRNCFSLPRKKIAL